jgi:succinate-semialdehyde dehydrogenase/glutarate-semialdehyde dehydrogenase
MLHALSDKALFKQALFIDGRWEEKSGKGIEVFNPANGELLGAVPQAGPDDIRRALVAAEKAFEKWRQVPAKERSAVLKRWHGLVLEAQEDLAKIITLEQGKPLAESRGEIAYAAAYIEWFAEEAKRAYGDIIPSHRPDSRLLVLKQPVGVVGTITPWNFPSAMLARKAAPAFAAGCAVVSKPAELTPFSALALAVLAERAGLPAGVWNLLTGVPQEIGAELCASPIVRKLSFTGSTRVGKLLMEQSASTLKRLSMELGGNAPLLVFESADVDLAIKGALQAKYRNAGQTCICVNRFYVHEKIYETFAEKLCRASQALTVGNGMDAQTVVGPLINEAAVEKVERMVGDARQHGAKILCGAKRSTLGFTFYEPTVVTDARPEMMLSQEEIFGPVAALFRFSSDEEAIRLANATPYGLAGYFYSRDAGQIWRVAERLECGMIGINETAISAETIPFGGVKESGFGREGSKYGLDDYMQTKLLTWGGLS